MVTRTYTNDKVRTEGWRRHGAAGGYIRFLYLISPLLLSRIKPLIINLTILTVAITAALFVDYIATMTVLAFEFLEWAVGLRSCRTGCLRCWSCHLTPIIMYHLAINRTRGFVR